MPPDSTPIPGPPKLPSGVGSTEPHALPPTGPPEPMTPELRAILELHGKVDALSSMMAKFFVHEQEQDDRLEALESDDSLPNGHSFGG